MVNSIGGSLLEMHNGITQSADFLAVKASLSPQIVSIIPDSYTYLLKVKIL